MNERKPTVPLTKLLFHLVTALWKYHIVLVLDDYDLKLAFSLSLYVPCIADVHEGGPNMDASGAAGLR